MRLQRSRINEANKLNTSVSAYMEQTNLFSLTLKRNIRTSSKIIPLNLRDISKYQYFYDPSIDTFNITKEEYIKLCEDIVELFLKVENTNNRSQNVKLLRLLNKLGIFLIFFCVTVFIAMKLTIAGILNYFLSIFLPLIFIVYFLIVIIFCVLYIIKISITNKRASEHIKNINLYIFKLNVKYKNKGVEFKLHTNAKELIIQKRL